MSDLRTDLADAIRELADPYEHTELLRLRSAVPGGDVQEIRVHRARFPSLLDQLRSAVAQSAGAESGARGYESKPSANLDAIDRMREIRRGVAEWRASVCGLTQLRADLHALVGMAWTDGQLKALVRDARRWVTWARIATAWDTPAMRPRATCPACTERGTLRVRIDQLRAMCVGCGEVWTEDEGGIYVLGRWVRACHDELEEEVVAA